MPDTESLQTMPETENLQTMPETEAQVVEEPGQTSGGKRKRGRKARAQPKAPTRRKDEEDVCFICFDGGELVLCDRRFCPKAYHPTCINRDPAFFRTKGRWNCGWHLCSNCEKSAHFLCCTCTYSLCKVCIKEADFFCVRGNKGFCNACFTTIMLIEKNQANTAEIDFDDRTSWEFLFKEYWLDLKRKLSLTLEELSKARNPSKDSSSVVRKDVSSDELYDANDDHGSVSDDSSVQIETPPARKKPKRRSKSLPKDEIPQSAPHVADVAEISTPKDLEVWASKELLEFVGHMKDGDTSRLSHFELQDLLLKYIKQNKLRDPRKQSQIICDSRLQNLFGKPRVGHFEMLKLIESHFLTKEVSSEVSAHDTQEGALDSENNQMDTEGARDATLKTGHDKKRKSRKKVDERGHEANQNDYAAIDVHNINLIYLRRNLVEDLLDDLEKFQDKVVGSFVRIRISSTSNKQDMYRLVQVLSTSKAAEFYKTGRKTTDILLDILNLNKTEAISIDSISNQEFSEEECKRLRQSIKCGLLSRLTVGEIQERARAIQAVKVNDWFETEILRLSHLRDRASEKGRRKELRECVEKLQVLKSPEERERKLNELPDVHTDPNMDPDHESDDAEEEPDDTKSENYRTPRDARFSSRKGNDPISPGKGASSEGWDGGTRRSSGGTRDSSRNSVGKSGSWERGGSGASSTGNTWDRSKSASTWGTPKEEKGDETCNQQTNQTLRNQSNDWSSSKTQPVIIGSAPSSNASKSELPSSLVGVNAPTAQLVVPSETEKVWHYQDPSGAIQGPFSMTQLRKWSTTGYFPAELKIWKVLERQEDAMLLTDALAGKFLKERQSSSWEGTMTGVAEIKEGLAGGSSNPNQSWSSQAHGQRYQTTPQFPATFATASNQRSESLGGIGWNTGQNHGNSWNSNRELGAHSGGNNANDGGDSLKDWSASSLVVNTKSSKEVWESGEQTSKNELSELPTPTPKSSSGGFTGDMELENKQTGVSLTTKPENGSWGGQGNTWSSQSLSSFSGSVPMVSVPKGNETLNQDIGNDLPSPTPGATPTSTLEKGTSNIGAGFETSPSVTSVCAGEALVTKDSVVAVSSLGQGSLSVWSPQAPVTAKLSQDSHFFNMQGSVVETVGGFSQAPSVNSQVPNIIPNPTINDHGSQSNGLVQIDLNPRAVLDSWGQAQERVHPWGGASGLSGHQWSAPTSVTIDRTSGSGWVSVAAQENFNPNSGLGTTKESPNPNSSWGTALGNPNPNSGWGAVENPSPNLVWGSSGNSNMGWGANKASEGGGHGGWGPQRHDGDGLSSGRGGGWYGDSGHGGRPWSGRPGGGGPRPSRGQKVCKFHESGHCKKGSSCDFLHP
ncbi:zinc finger CCCH domain-containing protein 19 [Amborella trichopoda]|uniref:zinc finger CCCH domain-containing protein 19 n=1 Tax=Amborella trichopoda TaxID=13333 RepID=UPI0005D460A8|nr:zinc finger CCCH domain-containing protein 19 [Amborella trichopoda]|eukprot:XP_011625190.1 zinc finger CCCH domain-containing protein 19 [Amborella trichopoda]